MIYSFYASSLELRFGVGVHAVKDNFWSQFTRLNVYDILHTPLILNDFGLNFHTMQ